MADKKRAKKIDRRETREIRDEGKEHFNLYVNKFTDKRLFLRLVWGRSVKPCGRECREYGYLIANEFSDHSSFENFPTLMDDKEFLLQIAKTSRNPATCPIYFYDYVNPYLKKDAGFRLEFLKQIYLNDNVYTLEDINTIVEYLGMKKENRLILSNLEFRRLFEKRLDKLSKEHLEYHCSGNDTKELRKFKISANELKVFIENKKRGLTEILNSFTVGEKKKVVEEPQTYYEFLLQSYKTQQSL